MEEGKRRKRKRGIDIVNNCSDFYCERLSVLLSQVSSRTKTTAWTYGSDLTEI